MQNLIGSIGHLDMRAGDVVQTTADNGKTWTTIFSMECNGDLQHARNLLSRNVVAGKSLYRLARPTWTPILPGD